LKPYKHIETHHLGFLLFVARLFAVVGFLFLGLVLVVVLGIIFGGPSPFSYSRISMATALPLTLGLLGLSGVFAAIVAFEEGFRKRTEALLSKTEILHVA
jgi:hypothetical protein